LAGPPQHQRGHARRGNSSCPGRDGTAPYSLLIASAPEIYSGDQFVGKPFAADFVFHNAYGPGSGWFYDPKLSGGGCLIDLGVHLVDLALWLFDFPAVVEARGRALKDGRPVERDECEDFVTGELELSNGVTVRVACS
jgi:predicted dehydrogenase